MPFGFSYCGGLIAQAAHRYVQQSFSFRWFGVGGQLSVFGRGDFSWMDGFAVF